eukprot:TRINITY_DN19242_c0_g1_i3.p4 TRINITY_DN19242_c0_g1~~TRINITY_DN19242_c0_g1_i3.p4  ORF type:complete len:138 (+),score=27.37 TRINITY_DN19242_c0_g1_i3:150-563(+)
MIRRPPRSTHCISSAASDVYKRQPSLFIKDGADASRWAGIELVTDFYFKGKPILFSRLGFTPEFLAVFSPKTREMPDSDALGIWYPKVIDTFEKYFRITTPEEYGISGPISMVHRLEDNQLFLYLSVFQIRINYQPD